MTKAEIPKPRMRTERLRTGWEEPVRKPRGEEHSEVLRRWLDGKARVRWFVVGYPWQIQWAKVVRVRWADWTVTTKPERPGVRFAKCVGSPGFASKAKAIEAQLKRAKGWLLDGHVELAERSITRLEKMRRAERGAASRTILAGSRVPSRG